MSVYKEELRDSILNYLQTEFPDFSIEEQLEEESYCFRLVRQSNTHFLRVMYSATEGNSPIELSMQLEQYCVASTMRGLGEFPVVVTEQGCIFGAP